MPEMPQIKDSQPILNPVNVASDAEGLEAFTKSLSALSQTAASKTEEIETDKSQAMYINSVSNLEQLKTTSEMRMLEHPDQAPRISQDMQDAVDLVKRTAYVNDKDRNKLNSYASSIQDGVDLKATETEVKQRQLGAAFTHFENWPSQLSAYYKALLTDHDQAEELKGGMLSTLKGLVMTRAITPEQAGTSIKMMQGAVDVANGYHSYLTSDHPTARGYQTLAANPYNEGADNAGTPVNENSAWQVDYYNNDKSLQGALAATYERKNVPPEVYLGLKPAQRDRLVLTKQGVMTADGIINSGESYAAIEKVHQTLSESGKVLSYKDQATKNALGVYINDLKNGNYLDTIGRTPMGGEIMQNFVARDSAIRNLAVDDQKKAQLLNQNKNDNVTQLVALGHGLHIPSEYIRPVPKNDLANMENGFKVGQDPAQTLQVFNQYSKQNQVYIANSFANPQQRLMMQAMSFAGNDVKPQDKLDFIAANQEGRNYGAIDLKSNNVKEEELKNTAITKLNDQIRYIGKQYDFNQAQVLQGSMINSVLNYAKFIAAKNNNLQPSSSDMKGYIDQAAQMYAKTFKPITGTNYAVNENQLPGSINKAGLDHLAEYVINKGYDHLRQGRSEAEFNAATAANPLKMILSPTNDVQAVDGNGSVYFSTPYNEHLVSAAIADKANRKAQEEKNIKEASSKAFEKTNKVMLGMNNANENK